jgi:hypothetical protein
MNGRKLLERYDETYDCDGTVKIAGLTFERSKIVKKLDPIAYRVYLADFVDGLAKDGEVADADLDRILLDAYEELER